MDIPLFTDYLNNFEHELNQLFVLDYDINELSIKRGFPPEVLKRIMNLEPLSVAIPKKYGGRGANVKECLSILSAASYHSLPLSLTLGINIALFLEPIAKYGHPEVKNMVLNDFIKTQKMGGMMITEPNFGSDALNMRTSNRVIGQNYHVKGYKHWQGLTGTADYWLVASRHQQEDGTLCRDIDFFLCNNTIASQQIIVEELYDSAGLYMIPYGLNKIDIIIPKQYKLIPDSTGVKMMLDILHRSRMQFPGMGMGFIKRMLDEAFTQCKERNVGGSTLLSLDNVQSQLARLQASFTICSAMCCRSASISGIENNLASQGLEANVMKALITDLMQESAQLLVQLSGAKGYRTSHIGARGIMDSRPFQIFEGSNEMLYVQIAETILKLMRKHKQYHLYQFFCNFPLTIKCADRFKSNLSFVISDFNSQRKLVDFGKIISRVIVAAYVTELMAKGFSKNLGDNCMVVIGQDVSLQVSSYKFKNNVQNIEDYLEKGMWQCYC